jgi:hypothetical protein
MASQLKTYGDLKKVIKSIALKQKGEKIGSVALDQIINLIPGVSAAKTTFDFVKAAISKPDDKKTSTWLDKLDIDDNTSAIIDNTVENGFMKFISTAIEDTPDDKELENDFNMNQKLVNYLKTQYNGRTITGIQENNKKQTMKKSQLKHLIREIINEEEQIKGDTSVLISNLKKLNISDFDPSKISTTISLVKQNK